MDNEYVYIIGDDGLPINTIISDVLGHQFLFGKSIKTYKTYESCLKACKEDKNAKL